MIMRATQESSHNLCRSREVLEWLGEGGRWERGRESYRHGSKQGRITNTSSHMGKTEPVLPESHLHTNRTYGCACTWVVLKLPLKVPLKRFSLSEAFCKCMRQKYTKCFKFVNNLNKPIKILYDSKWSAKLAHRSEMMKVLQWLGLGVASGLHSSPRRTPGLG